jgi:hypothetical protein
VANSCTRVRSDVIRLKKKTEKRPSAVTVGNDVTATA